MAGKLCVEYEIAIKKEYGGGMHTVTGYPITLQVPGEFAVRRIVLAAGGDDPERELWAVDDIETGALVACGETRDDAITRAIAVAEIKGADEFLKARMAFAERR